MRALLSPLLLCALVLTWPGRATAQKALDIYGYFDMEAEISNQDAAKRFWNFDQHHFNLIIDHGRDARSRFLGEVEWEHGPSHAKDEMVGKMYVGNLLFEYKRSDALRVRLGHFATPFGIYNERHDATPTFISTKLPESIYGKYKLAPGVADRGFAKFTTGVQLVGTVFRGGWGGTYHLYLGNGRSDDPGGRDDNANKGVGGRLVLMPPVQYLSLGMSVYADRNGRSFDARQRALGFDTQWDRGPLHVESEVLLLALEQIDDTGTPKGSFDHGIGAYLLAGYTLFDRLMPFGRIEHIDIKYGDEPAQVKRIATFGVNASIMAATVVKAELHLYRNARTRTDDYEVFIASLATTF